MVRVTFDRPGIDSTWTADHKRTGLSKSSSASLELLATPWFVVDGEVDASFLTSPDSESPAEIVQPEKRPKLSKTCVEVQAVFQSDALPEVQIAKSDASMSDEQDGEPQVDHVIGHNDEVVCAVMVYSQASTRLGEDHVHDKIEAVTCDGVMFSKEQKSDSEQECKANDHEISPRQAEQDTTEVANMKTAVVGRCDSRFGRCWQGLVELTKSGLSRPRPASLADKTLVLADTPDVELQQALLESSDPELQQALRESAESASLTSAKEVSAAEARERLEHVMNLYHAKAQPVQADGNCQFRALSRQLYGDEDFHATLRARVIEQLEAKPERYADFVHEPFADYVKRMACNGEWGDNVTLQAASDLLCTDIHLLTDQPGGECIQVHPAEHVCSKEQKPLCLTFLTEVHYDAAEFL